MFKLAIFNKVLLGFVTASLLAGLFLSVGGKAVAIFDDGNSRRAFGQSDELNSQRSEQLDQLEALLAIPRSQHQLA